MGNVNVVPLLHSVSDIYVVSLNTVKRSSLNLSTELTSKKFCSSPNNVCKLFAINDDYFHVEYKTVSFKI